MGKPTATTHRQCAVFSRARDEKFAWIGRDLIWRWEQPHQGGAIAMQDPECEIPCLLPSPIRVPQAYRAAVAAEGGGGK